jgi:hypothetical protein
MKMMTMISFLARLSLFAVLAGRMPLFAQAAAPGPPDATSAQGAATQQAGGAGAFPRAPEVRLHRMIGGNAGMDSYVVTEIRRGSGSAGQTILLVENAQGDRFLFTNDRDDGKHADVYEIRDIAGHEFLRVTLFTTFPDTARSKVTGAGNTHPVAPEPEVRFEYAAGSNGLVGGFSSHWRDPDTGREWRSRIRSMLAPQFLESLEILYSSGFIHTTASRFESLLLDPIMYRNHCAAPTLASTPIPGDCAFDKKFGFACAVKQLERAGKARAAQEPTPSGDVDKPY